MKLKEDSFIRWDLGFIVQKNMSPVKNPYHSRDRFCNYELQDLDFLSWKHQKKEDGSIRFSKWYKNNFTAIRLEKFEAPFTEKRLRNETETI